MKAPSKFSLLPVPHTAARARSASPRSPQPSAWFAEHSPQCQLPAGPVQQYPNTAGYERPTSWCDVSGWRWARTSGAARASRVAARTTAKRITPPRLTQVFSSSLSLLQSAVRPPAPSQRSGLDEPLVRRCETTTARSPSRSPSRVRPADGTLTNDVGCASVRCNSALPYLQSWLTAQFLRKAQGTSTTSTELIRSRRSAAPLHSLQSDI